MALERELVLDLAEETGFRAETLEKVLRLSEILGDVGKHPLLSTALALKGGTALHLFPGPPPRLSVDLDFNYVAAEDRDTMLRDRPEIERAIELLSRARKYALNRSSDEHAGRKFYLKYANISGTPDRIEVDLNFVHRVPLAAARRLSMWQPGDLDRPMAQVVAVEELCAGKLCALFGRSVPRDLFDAARLPAYAGRLWKKPRLRALFVAMAGALDQPFYHRARERLSRVTSSIVERQLHPMLARSTSLTADALIQDALQVVSPFLLPDAAEKEYIDRLQHGELRPELLFPDDPESAERIRRHPVLLWKAQNAKAHASKKAPTRRPREEP